MENPPTEKDIYDTIEARDTELAMALILKSPEGVHMATCFGTWLHEAADRGNLKLVKLLVAAGADVNRRAGIYGGNALNEAASEGRLKVVRYLLSKNAEMDTSEPERNPLFSAIQARSIGIVRLLLAHGIDPHVRYNGKQMKNMDAATFAMHFGQTEIAQLLAEA